MNRRKRRFEIAAVLAGLVVTMGAVQAAGRAILKVEYRGWTTQAFAPKSKAMIFHGVIRVDIDRNNNRVAFYGMRINCSAKTGYIVTSSVRTKIDRKGNFRYKLSSSHLKSISGHVTTTKITGTFTGAQALGCNVRGTYSAIPSAEWPPKPQP